MKAPDLDRIRSEKSLTLAAFASEYNRDLPAGFPEVTVPLLRDFKKSHASLFKDGHWSLDVHRKKVMDWLPGHLRRGDDLSPMSV